MSEEKNACSGCPSASSGNGCGSCGASNKNEKEAVNNMMAPINAYSSIKHVIGVVGGKGGVGKSLVTSLLAITMARKGFKVGILDADITGPSIPKIFGVKERLSGDEHGLMIPAKSKDNVDIVSVNLLLENEETPVIWRGPVLGNVVKQFFTDTLWENIDYLFVDMPPGTGDVPITVFQSLPLDGIIVVTSPQELVGMIVEKAVCMAEMMKIPIIGIVENMSYFHCPDNGKKYQIFGESHIDEIIKKYELLLLGKIPIDPKFAKLCDEGKLESIEKTMLEDIALPE